jgi:uncharacterized protein (DUF4213/DUF364 family)
VVQKRREEATDVVKRAASLVQAWTEDLRGRIPDPHLAAEDVRVGVFYTAVQLSTGDVGVAFTPRGLVDAVCCPRSAASAPPAGRLAGQPVWALAEYATSPVPLRRAVGVAALNALSSLAVERFGVPGGLLLRGLDALQAADVRPEDRVAMVGAFAPFLRALKGQVADLWVVDRHPDALKDDERTLWRPPDQAEHVLRAATVVVVTGSALVEGGVEVLLEASRGARRVVLAGPTTALWPVPFFRWGVHVLAGIRVLDGPKLLRIVGEGGSGYFFEDAAEKVAVVRGSAQGAASPVPKS